MSGMMRTLLICLLLLGCAACAWADEAVFEPMSGEECQRFLENSALVLREADYADWPAVCFDVRNDGMIALGFDKPGGGKYAAVLDADGTYQYGYSFRSSGSFLLDWEADGLGVIWIRSDVRGVFDSAGQCLRLESFEFDRAFSRYASALRRTERTTDTGTYALRNDHPLAALSSNYGKLVYTDAQGTEHVLHDAEGASVLSGVNILAVIVFVAVCVAFSARQNRAPSIDNPPKS